MSLEYKASESISNTIRTDNVVKPPCKLGTSGTLEPKSLEGSLESISHTISTDNVGEPMWKREHSAKDLSREVSEDCEDTDTDTLIRVVDASEKRVRVVHNLSFLPDITQTIAAKPLQKHVQNQAEHLPPHRNWTLSRTIGLQYGVIVTGLTILDSKLYTIFQNSSNIEVYDSANFVFVKDIKISGSVNPNDITSCKLFSSLYICDWGSSHIFRVKIRKKMEQTSWSIDGDIGNISVTAEHSILLAGYISSKLKEYNPNGKLLRTITIEDDFKPWHAIRLASSDFIICQGDYSSGNHRVCLADSNGKLIESFGGNRGSDEAHLCGPYHLAVDKSGCILVNDCNNRRILLLSPAMRFIKEIISSSSKVLRRARRMCLDEAAGRLYVADNATTGGETTDGRIQVFSVS